jgi:hypothetical protein
MVDKCLLHDNVGAEGKNKDRDQSCEHGNDTAQNAPRSLRFAQAAGAYV